ncbi:MFS transporter [Actinomadura roseirufa]|uniref:MFS transporter n=1 Tax=Actinomadura roseirufa TaxID=2094049 RepID=UPI0013F148F2|nr:MFS transporter [Actinomadura roseirufa]
MAEARAVPGPALVEPVVPVSGGWIAANTLANLGMAMAVVTPPQFQLADQAAAFGSGGRFLVLGLVNAAGSLAGIVSTPLIGALSDRTSRGSVPILGSGHGRRHPWTLVTAIAGALCLVLLGYQDTAPGIIGCWFGFNFFQGGMFASLSASVPDLVPPQQRATVSGWVGMPQALGLVAGGLLVTRLTSGVAGAYLLLAAGMVTLALPFVLLTRDPVLEPWHRPPFSAAALVRSFGFDPRRHPDFGWAWLARLLMMTAHAVGTLYLPYFLEGAVDGHAGGAHRAESRLLVLVTVFSLVAVVAAVAAGITSDRLARRRPLVAAAGLTMAAAALSLAFFQSWSAVLAAAVVFGLGFGAYIAVSQALITEVLPAAENRAKDLGVVHIANLGSYVIGGVVAVPVVALGGYSALYVLVSITALIGSLVIFRVRGVR